MIMPITIPTQLTILASAISPHYTQAIQLHKNMLTWKILHFFSLQIVLFIISYLPIHSNLLTDNFID